MPGAAKCVAAIPSASAARSASSPTSAASSAGREPSAPRVESSWTSSPASRVIALPSAAGGRPGQPGEVVDEPGELERHRARVLVVGEQQLQHGGDAATGGGVARVPAAVGDHALRRDQHGLGDEPARRAARARHQRSARSAPPPAARAPPVARRPAGASPRRGRGCRRRCPDSASRPCSTSSSASRSPPVADGGQRGVEPAQHEPGVGGQLLADGLRGPGQAVHGVGEGAGPVRGRGAARAARPPSRSPGGPARRTRGPCPSPR